MKLIWQYLKKQRKVLTLALIFATINQVFSLLDPQIFRILIDKYATRIEQIPRADFISGVLLLLAAYVGVSLVSRIAKNVQDYFVNVTSKRLGANMYGDSVKHAFSLPYKTFADRRSGEILEKMSKARLDIEQLIDLAVNNLFFSLIGILFVLTYAFTVHWSIGLTYFLLIPLLGFATSVISRRLKDVQQNIVRETAELAGSTTETLRNVELVKSLGLEIQEIDRLNNVNDQILELEVKKVKMVRTLSFIQGTLINALRAIIMMLMFYLMFLQSITLGEFFTLLFYSFLIFNPLSQLGQLVTKQRESEASAAELDLILNLPPEPQPTQPVDFEKISSIEFKNVFFRHEETNKKESVANIDLSLQPGQTMAFVGPSGAGKTTVVKLLVGLYKPDQGAIHINGHDLQRINRSDYRRRIGLVAQDTQLFAGTIRENLLFVKPQATDEQCIEALRHAEVDHILHRGDGGLDTKIGEGGIKLSGGEKQRLAIARALLRNPDLLIFDEATSSLDSLTENKITDTVKKIRRKRPMVMQLIIAHRLSTVIHADLIIVLDKGRIVQRGTHAELLKNEGLYQSLCRILNDHHA
ncbi:MAG: ABC transporter ATP-binding protein/permease [Candidatus Komeilibacteria bacterium]|nr:ABC transporter ATP-binding protein/permease [Candidatus Komeilibacteria bacterium]